MLEEAEEIAVHVEDVSTVSKELDGKLIHATAMSQTKDILSDPIVDFKGNTVKLERSVKYYQWVEHKSNTTMTWLLRIVGLLLVIGGSKGIFNILITILKVLPFLADIAGLGVGLVCNIAGLVWSLIIIAIVWLFYRPVIAVIMIAVIVGLIIYLSQRGKADNATPQPTV